MYTVCPKCKHSPLPTDQALPAACPACGIILAKVAQAQRDAELDIGILPGPSAPRRRRRGQADDATPEGNGAFSLRQWLLHRPAPMDEITWWSCAALLAAFAIWGWVLMAQDYRSGDIGSSFMHKPLLVFHEAGHVVFRPFGEWMTVLGGSLGQLIMPAILCGALLVKNRDPFGASMGLWLVGVSLLDLAPYMYDSLHPQLMLLSGRTGEEGGHDWIYLFSSLGWLQKSQFIGGLVHKLGALTVLLALAWGATVLRLEFARRKSA